MLHDDKLAHARRLAKEWLESFEFLNIAEDDELQYQDENVWDDIYELITDGEVLIGQD